MKAAIASPAQVRDRTRRMRELGLPLALELHTFGADDLHDAACLDAGRRLREQHGAELVVHVPPQEPAVVGDCEFDAHQVRRTVEFAHAVGAHRVVVHRYLRLRRQGIDARARREEEGERFTELLVAAVCDSEPLTVHVENLGFFWLRPRRRRRYMVSCLDHFFPWEQDAFVASLAQRGIRNVRPMVDVAHAALSANMFNLRRRHAERFAADARFSSILPADLERAASLGPLDFVHPDARHVHCSDTIVAAAEGIADPAPPERSVWRWLTTEGLALGDGNFDLEALVDRLTGVRDGPVTIVPEIHSGPAQQRAIARLEAMVVTR